MRNRRVQSISNKLCYEILHHTFIDCMLSPTADVSKNRPRKLSDRTSGKVRGSAGKTATRPALGGTAVARPRLPTLGFKGFVWELRRSVAARASAS